jgi:hypothetical protein
VGEVAADLVLRLHLLDEADVLLPFAGYVLQREDSPGGRVGNLVDDALGTFSEPFEQVVVEEFLSHEKALPPSTASPHPAAPDGKGEVGSGRVRSLGGDGCGKDDERRRRSTSAAGLPEDTRFDASRTCRHFPSACLVGSEPDEPAGEQADCQVSRFKTAAKAPDPDEIGITEGSLRRMIRGVGARRWPIWETQLLAAKVE